MVSKNSPIAIIGMACRFPGGASGGVTSPDAFWDLLAGGGDAVSEIPDDRWEKRLFGHPDPMEAGRAYTFRAGTLGDVSGFDAAFFGISPREAEQMDPQQRLLLEMAWEALERGGQVPEHLAGAPCAVYVGISSTDYADLRQADPAGANAYFMLGSTLSIAANRLSYIFDLRGPSMAIDTACSSSLVALHEAVCAIQGGRASMAIVGGVHLLLSPYPFGGFCKASMLSSYGQCRAFDKLAKGYVRGEGGGVLVLKPLADAERDGDPIHAVIRGVGVNSDGRTQGIALPSSEMQEALLRRVYATARIHPRDVAYFEAHGTGTTVGDPAECGSVGRAIGRRRPRKDPLPIGSVKTNIGHLEPASGMAGVIKVVQILRKRAIPPSLHLDEPNPEIDFKGLNLRPVTALTPLPDTGKPAVAGVNSFGFGGANAHVILQEYRPASAPAPVSVADVAAGLPPVLLSARSEPALRAQAAQLADWLESTAATPDALYDAAHTLAYRRAALEHRLVARPVALAAGGGSGALAGALRAYAAGEAPEGVNTGSVIARRAKVALLFSGNGSQWAGMGAQLLDEDPVFRAVVEAVDALVRAEAGWSVIDELRAGPETSKMDDTRYAQPLLFAVQAGMVASLKAGGLEAGAATGHSVGEVAAAYAAGVLSLEQAVHVIVQRSIAQGRTKGLGRMAAADIDAARAAREIAPFGGRVEIAAVNSPKAVTLSGDLEALQAIGQGLAAEGVAFRLLDLDYAFHNQVLDPVRDDLLAALAGVVPAAGEMRFFSTVTGGELDGGRLDARYWWDNVRQPVQFHGAVAAMSQAGFEIFLEIGPHPIMQGYVRQTLRALEAPGQPVSAMTRQKAGRERIERALDQVWTLGGTLALDRLFARPGRPVDLPTYPFQRERHWFRLTPEARGPNIQRYEQPLLGVRPAPAVTLWESQIDAGLYPFLADHVVGDSVVFPAAGFLELALEASRQQFGDGPHDIEQMEIRRPLVLEAGRSKMVRLAWNPEDGIFTIESRTRMHDEPWSVHVTGRLARAAHAVPVAAGDAAPPAGAQVVEAAEHYAFAERLGLAYGPLFQAVRRVHVGRNEALAELEAPEGLPLTEELVLHPALFDGCLQVLFDLVRARAGDGAAAAEPVAFLPYQAGRVLLHGRGGAVRLCRVRLDAVGPRSLVASFVLMDGDGTVLGEVRRFRFQRVELKRRRDAGRLFHAFAPVPLTPLVPLPVAGPLVAPDALAAAAAQAAEGAVQPVDAATVAGAFAAAALRVLGGGALNGTGHFTLDGLMVAGSVALERRPLLERAIALAVDAGLAVAESGSGQGNGGWRLAATLPDPDSLWREALAARPDCLAELTLAGRAGRHLAAVLRGADAGLAAPSPALLDQFHDASPTVAPACDALAAAVARVAAAVPAHRRLRVLEVGAGSGSVARRLLPLLPARAFDYVIADADEEALAHIEGDLADRPEVSALRLDLTAPLDGQAGVTAHGFDLIVGSNLLKGTAAPTLALETIRQLLGAHGLLLLAEVAPQPWLDLAFGLEPGWWREAGGPDSAARGRLLDAAAMAEAAQAAGLVAAQVIQAGGGLVMAAAGPAVATAPAVAVPAKEGAGPWILLADPAGAEAGLAEALADRLAAAGHLVLQVGPGDGFALDGDHAAIDLGAPEAWGELLHTLADLDAPPQGVIHLLGLGETVADGAGLMALQDRRCWSTLALVQALGKAGLPAPPRLVLVTAGTHRLPAPFAEADLPVPAEAPLWGVGRVLMNEHPELAPRLIDLHPGSHAAVATASAAWAEVLAAEVLAGHEGGEDEILLGLDRRLGLRLRAVAPARPVAAGGTVEAEGEGETLLFSPGSLDNLTWGRAPRRAPEAGEVEFAVKATGLNFRDVMFALGVLPDEAVENGFAGATVGMEAAGVITRVGPGVTDHAPGDEVMCFAPACFGSHVVTRTTALAPKPSFLSFAEAATVPTVFFTVYYALGHLARLEKGERVLIHGAAGGVGLAAIQYARHVGAEIFATAGSEEKRDLVRMMGVPDDHVLDSRSVAFADQILALTGPLADGGGVDVVLNSLAGEAIHKSLSVLRPFGRFLELGKRDFYANSRVGLRPFRNNLTYYGIDADQLMMEKPALAARLFREMTALFGEGVFAPLPYRVFPRERVVEAFRHMQQSKHVGKIVVAGPLERAAALTAVAGAAATGRPAALALDPAAAYLVTGGLAGFGLATAHWLADKGARHLVLLSRRGAATPEAEQAVADFAARGVEVLALACDVTDEAAVRDAVAQAAAGRPLKGIIHAAAVFADGIADTMGRDQFASVLAPKVAGAWALHRASLDQPLDFFVVYSSVTTLLGNPGQSNYVAANLYLESLIGLRRAMGLPGLAACWGAIADAGYLTRNTDVQESLQNRLGAAALTAAEAMAALETLLLAGNDVMAVVDLDWKVLRGGLPAVRSARFSELATRAGGGDGEEAVDIHALIADLTPAEVRELLIEMIAEQVAHVLRMPADKLDRKKSIFDMGMDSLMALELRMMIEEKFGIELPAMAISEGASITRLAERIRDHLVGDAAAEAAPAGPADGVVASLMTRHSEAMEDEALRAVLEDVENDSELGRTKLIS